MRANRILAAACFVAVVVLLPRASSADGFFTPFFGGNSGGTIDELQTDGPKSYGFSFGWMKGGVFGLETDIAFSPDFYGDSDNLLFGSNSVTTSSANLIVGVPIGSKTGFSVRPYGTGGIGWFRQRVEGFESVFDLTKNSVGFDYGGGAFVFFTSNFGARVDFRQFRTEWDSGDLVDGVADALGFDVNLDGVLEPERKVTFMRTTVGLVLRW